MREISIYVHVPFCDHKCIYCDFYSIITNDNIEPFFKALNREIEFYSHKIDDELFVNSIYFGGGTPSYVEPYYIAEIIGKLEKAFVFGNNMEITLETNPGTVDRNKLRTLKEIGINRLSIGIQSFDEKELKFLTRIHNSSAAINTVEDAFAAGINNLSVDLIFNLPGQTKKVWKANLEQATKLPIKHLSAYSLILERGTILNKMVLDGKVKLQDENYDADLYEITIDFLTGKGFLQYEVSNFCKPDYECRHNLVYWKHKEYLGFGTSAHSFWENRRWWNYSSLKMYINSVDKTGHAKINEELLNREELQQEYLLLHLRGSGLNLNKFTDTYGIVWLNKNNLYLDALLSEGFITRSDNFIKFTKRGYLLCDEIIAKFK